MIKRFEMIKKFGILIFSRILFFKTLSFLNSLRKNTLDSRIPDAVALDSKSYLLRVKAPEVCAASHVPRNLLRLGHTLQNLL